LFGATLCNFGGEEKMTKKFLGFQLANKQGENIQGDDCDPTILHSFEIMTPALATYIISQCPECLLMPIFEEMIEEYELIGFTETNWLKRKWRQ